MSSDADEVRRSEAGSGFQTTHWSVVLTAKGTDSEERLAALNALCRTYWYPLYAFVRRQGRDPHQAEDLTQDFLARLLAKDGLASVRPESGRFRSFLLAALKNYLANDWDRQRTIKRGGNQVIISWDEVASEDRYLNEPADGKTPETLFEKSWAMTLIQTVMERLSLEYAEAGKAPLFEAIHAYLEDDGAENYVQLGAQLGISEGSVKMAVFRLRENFRLLLRTEIANTVAEPGEVEDELRHLFACLSS